jgi:hypothetical protein
MIDALVYPLRSPEQVVRDNRVRFVPGSFRGQPLAGVLFSCRAGQLGSGVSPPFGCRMYPTPSSTHPLFCYNWLSFPLLSLPPWHSIGSLSAFDSVQIGRSTEQQHRRQQSFHLHFSPLNHISRHSHIHHIHFRLVCLDPSHRICASGRPTPQPSPPRDGTAPAGLRCRRILFLLVILGSIQEAEVCARQQQIQRRWRGRSRRREQGRWAEETTPVVRCMQGEKSEMRETARGCPVRRLCEPRSEVRVHPRTQEARSGKQASGAGLFDPNLFGAR